MNNFRFYFDTTSENGSLIFFLPSIVLQVSASGYDICFTFLIWQVGVKYEL